MSDQYNISNSSVPSTVASRKVAIDTSAGHSDVGFTYRTAGVLFSKDENNDVMEATTPNTSLPSDDMDELSREVIKDALNFRQKSYIVRNV